MHHNHHSILQALALEFQQLGKELKLQSVFSLSKQELHFRFFVHQKFILLRCQWAAGNFFMSFPEAPSILPRKRLHWFSDAESQLVTSINAPEGERVLQFKFANDCILQIQAFGPNANVVFSDISGQILSFKQKTNVSLIDCNSDKAIKSSPLNSFYIQTIHRTLPIFSTTFNAKSKEFKSAMQALTYFQQQYLATHSQLEKLRAAKADASRTLKKIRLRQVSLQKRLVEISKYEQYEHFGHLIMNHLHELKKGDSEAHVLDYNDGQIKRIKLNLELTPYENATRLYRKARNSRIENDQITAELSDNLLKEKEIEATLIDMEKGMIPEDQGQETLVSTKKTEGPSHRYFHFMGYRIYIGKNAINNDELTFGLAKKDDLWFHARGFSGSHVVIKRKDRNPIPRPVINAAAQAAAWFSQGRREAFCPVAFAEKKFVRKPKGAAAGAVIMERETVLMVEPRNPFQITD